MKVFVYIVVIALAVLSVQAILSEEQKTKLRALYTQCVQSSGVNGEIVLKARKREFSDDPKLKEYYHCMFKNLNFQKDDGSLDVDVIVAKLPLEKKEGVQPVVKDCVEKSKQGTKEEIAYKAMTCFISGFDEEINF